VRPEFFQAGRLANSFGKGDPAGQKGIGESACPGAFQPQCLLKICPCPHKRRSATGFSTGDPWTNSAASPAPQADMYLYLHASRVPWIERPQSKSQGSRHSKTYSGKYLSSTCKYRKHYADIANRKRNSQPAVKIQICFSRNSTNQKHQ
jgi:hypothetical protein